MLFRSGEAKECSEADLVEAIKVGHAIIIKQCEAQIALQKACGKTKTVVAVPEEDEGLKERVKAFAEARIAAIAKAASGKHERKVDFKQIKADFLATITEEELPTFNKGLFSKYYSKLEKTTIRNVVLDDKIRLDGRKTDEIRPLIMEVDVLPSPHGSALFTRGETQSLTTVTLGSKTDEQMIDKAEDLTFNKFMLHYNFPPFSTGEVKMLRGTSRREVGKEQSLVQSFVSFL